MGRPGNVGLFCSVTLEFVEMCGPQHADKNGIDNTLTDAGVFVFVICPCIAVALFVGDALAC